MAGTRRGIHIDADVGEDRVSIAGKYVGRTSNIGGSLSVYDNEPEKNSMELYVEKGRRGAGVGKDENGNYFFYRPDSWYGRLLAAVFKTLTRRKEIKIYLAEL